MTLPFPRPFRAASHPRARLLAQGLTGTLLGAAVASTAYALLTRRRPAAQDAPARGGTGARAAVVEVPAP
ncbi:hypothetical protein, partial [Nocardiopsis halotolerans]|uniref:hypothetical protein n=1 Tax=Nocardiopsis halotolerans TaxID=124252 RepID=UPI0005940933